jgi:hypothetical protein
MYVSETQAFGSRAGRYQIFQLLPTYLYPVYRKLLSYDLGYGLYKGHLPWSVITERESANLLGCPLILEIPLAVTSCKTSECMKTWNQHPVENLN